MKSTPLTLPNGMSYGEGPNGQRVCRGAMMGRISTLPISARPLTFRLVRVRLDSGGYDKGGAYWGLGQRLYWTRSLESVATVFDTGYETGRVEPVERFLRADDRADAKAQISEIIPSATFLR